MQSILQIKEMSRWEINRDAEHPTDQGDIELMGDQPRCRASYRSQRYRADWGSTEMQDRLQILQMMGDNEDADNADIKDAVDTVDTADREDTVDTIDVADTVETVDRYCGRLIETRMIINHQLY